MIDKTTKFLLAVIAGALCLLLVHEFGGGAPVQAQTPVAAVISQPPAVVVDNNVVYILQNGTLSAYFLDSPDVERMEPEVKKQKLRFLSSMKVQTAP